MSPIFEPPTVDDVPPVLDGPYPWPGGPVEYRFFGHMKSRARGVTVILMKDGTCFQVSYPEQVVPVDPSAGDVFTEVGLAGKNYTDIARVFMGGHVHHVSAAEATALIACGGYSANIHTLTWNQMVGAWQDYAGRTWEAP